MAVWAVPKIRTTCWKFGTVLGSPGTEFRTVIGPYVLFVC